jgi:antitoxin HigA-1
MKTTIEISGRMRNPAHPGAILKEMYMRPLGVTITQTADALGVSRKHVSGIVNGRVPVSPDMAARLAGVFGFWYEPLFGRAQIPTRVGRKQTT